MGHVCLFVCLFFCCGALGAGVGVRRAKGRQLAPARRQAAEPTRSTVFSKVTVGTHTFRSILRAAGVAAGRRGQAAGCAGGICKRLYPAGPAPPASLAPSGPHPVLSHICETCMTHWRVARLPTGGGSGKLHAKPEHLQGAGGGGQAPARPRPPCPATQVGSLSSPADEHACTRERDAGRRGAGAAAAWASHTPRRQPPQPSPGQPGCVTQRTHEFFKRALVLREGGGAGEGR